MNATCTLPGERYYYHFEELDESAGLEPAETQAVAAPEDQEKPSDGELRFWRRQFAGIATARQRKWDWLFGVFMPMICFYFDPILFRDWKSEYGTSGLLSTYQIPAYALAFAAIMAQAAWLLWGDRLGSFRIAIGLTLAAAAVASLVIGVVLFPFSLIGSVFLIGLLGFTPLFTSLIYWRNAVRAMRPPLTK